jgi:hypothetical protein
MRGPTGTMRSGLKIFDRNIEFFRKDCGVLHDRSATEGTIGGGAEPPCWPR